MKRIVPTLDRRASALCLAAIFISLAVKLAMLGSRELWLDETYSAYAAHLGLRELLQFTSGDVHPQLFSILLRGWTSIVGEAPKMLRLWSVLVNGLGMVGMYFVGRKLLGTQWGVLALSLFAFSPIMFVYALEVRSYSLLVTVTVAAIMLHWWVLVERSGTAFPVIAYSAALSLLFYIHYLGFFIVAGFLAHGAMIATRRRGGWTRLLGTGCLVALLIVPGARLAIHQRELKRDLDRRLQVSRGDPNALSFGPAVSVGENEGRAFPRIKAVAAMAGFYPASSGWLTILLGLPLVVVLAVTPVMAWARRDEVCGLFTIMVLALAAGMLSLRLSGTRYTLPLIPFLVLALARVIQRWSASGRGAVPGKTVCVCVITLYGAGFLRQAFKPHARPWETLVRAVQSSYKEGDLVVFDALYAQVPFDYYARQEDFAPRESGFPYSIYEWWSSQEHRAWGGPVIMRSDLERYMTQIATSKATTVWLVTYESYYYDPHEALRTRLQQAGSISEVELPVEVASVQSTGKDNSLRLFRISIR